MAKSLEDFSEDERNRMAQTYMAMLQHPETREVALRVTKKLDPSQSIPEIDLKDALRGELKVRDERETELAGKLAAAENRERIRAERDVLIGKGFSRADVDAIEAMIVEQGKAGNVLTYGYAAELYKQAQDRTLEPAPFNNRQANARKFELPSNPFQALKGGKQGVSAWARGEASAALDDLHAGRVKLQ
jgi:hypothetical protein